MPLSAFVAAAVAASIALAAPAWAERCSGLADDDARLACYDHLATCATEQDPRTRLRCYDGRPAPAATSQAPAPAPAPEAQDAVAAPAASASRADESFPLPGKTSRERQDPVTARIVEVHADATGVHYLTLDNGQVWRELTNRDNRFEAGDSVTLSHGFLGSVNLRVEGRAGYIKVRRVR